MKLSLNSILLFALLIPFIMTYRISPGETPYWLFGLILLGLFLYLLMDLSIINLIEKTRNRIKYGLLWFLILATIGSAFMSAIIVRHQTSPLYNIHDIVLQQESAIRFLLDGKNPYSTSYFGTPLEQWNYSDKEVNPALFHFVMEPFYLSFALPFYFLSNLFFGFFDGRIPLLFLFFALLIMAFKLVKEPSRKLEFIILLAFNPAMLGYTLEGRSDIFMFAFLFAGFYLLGKNKLFLAGISIGLAFAVKQSAWPMLPFYAAYLFFKTKNISETFKNLLPLIITFFLISGPFLLWDYRSFLNSTVFYLSGSTPNSYPISGYGFGALLREFDFIKDSNSYYPFWIWQALIGLPLMIWLINWQKKENSVQKLIIIYGIFLFVFWYFSRYLNNSHLGYVSMVFITAYFWPKDK